MSRKTDHEVSQHTTVKKPSGPTAPNIIIDGMCKQCCKQKVSDIVKCLFCSKDFHAVNCFPNKERDCLTHSAYSSHIKPLLLKTGVNKKRSGNFAFICDPCITQFEINKTISCDEKVDKMDSRVNTLSEDVQEIKSMLQQMTTQKEENNGSHVVNQNIIALCKPKNERVAIKRIDLDKTAFSIDEVIKEVNVMSKFGHENIAKYYTAFVVKQELWVVMKLFGGGSVLDVMKNIIKTEGKSNGVFDEVTIATILKEVLKGLEYVHQNQYIHRDVKASNILLGEDGSVVLTDFGVSGLLYDYSDRKQKTRRTFVGTPCWMAPEVMEQVVGYNEKADVWSFGITAIELACGQAPYHNYPPMKILMMTLSKESAPTLDDCLEDNAENVRYSKPFKKIIERCLQKEPSKRPSVSEIKKDPFFKKAKDKQWIIDHLLHKGLTTNKRAQKVKRVPGTSGRLHNTPRGWEWSDDEYDDEKTNTATETTNIQEINNPVTSTNDETSNNQLPITSQQYQSTLQDTWRKLAILEQRPDIANLIIKIRDILDQLSLEVKLTPEIIEKLWDISRNVDDLIKDSDNRLPRELNMNIRMRNADKRLNDIQFGFVIGSDSPVQLAAELVTAGHINPKTASAVSESIQFLLDHFPICKRRNFKLSGIGLGVNDYDENKLIGYATLSVTG